MLQLKLFGRAVRWAVACGLTLLCSCHSDVVGEAPPKDAGPDVVMTLKMDGAPDFGPDVEGKDAPSVADARTISDGRSDSKPDAADAGVCKHELTNPACWSTYALRSDYMQGLSGAIFDGTYVNFLNGAWGSSGYNLRYDTTRPFDDTTAWGSFSNGSKVSGVSSGAFDSRYVYLISSSAADNGTAGGTYADVFGRYDSQAKQITSSAWSTVDITNLNGTADLTVPGYIGGAFDGRYLYFAPFGVGDKASGKVMRYDTKADFIAATSWSWFDVSTIVATAKGFQGALFDGRYLYLVPNASEESPFTGDSTPSGTVMRYDTKADFATAASWSTFDTGTLTPAARGFSGATFDGRYIYMAPDGDWLHGVVPVRYDTKAEFTDAASWRSFDLSKTNLDDFANVYFHGATFDGRYVYYIPSTSSGLFRYDTQGDFASASAWETVGMWHMGSGSSFAGATFDGRYLYIVPRSNDPIMRFDAVTPPKIPPGAGASFF